MKKLIALTLVAALSTSFVMADVGGMEPVSKDLKKIVEEGPYVETSQKGITLSGYVDVGYLYNFVGRGANMNSMTRQGPGNITEGDSTDRGSFQLNALKLVFEKALSDANELQAGFRADLMWGEDADIFGQDAAGSDSTFVEQAYVTFRLPYGNGIDFKVGKFVTILGYEVIERPVNMNITYGNIFWNLIPLWHTGGLVSYQVNDIVDLQLGIVNGNNTDVGVGTDAEDSYSVIASVNATVPGGNANWYNAVLYGINGEGAGAFDDAPYIIYDTWMNWVPKFADDKLLLGANFNLGNGHVTTDTGALTDDPNTTTWWGWAFYTKYQFNEIFSLAGRFDYIHNDDSALFGNDPAAGVDDSEDIWSCTITGSFDVIENMMLRTEYRLDWGKDFHTNNTGGAADGTLGDGPVHTAGVQVVYSF